MRKSKLEKQARRNRRLIPVLQNDDYAFWLCHGLNYLASDYDKGLWTPVFDEIYGTEPVMLDPSAMVQRIVTLTEHNDVSSDVGSLMVAWSVLSVEDISRHVKALSTRMVKAKLDPKDATLPHQPFVWDYFYRQQQKVAAIPKRNIET